MNTKIEYINDEAVTVFESFDDFEDPADEEYRLEKVLTQPIFDDVDLDDDYFNLTT